MRICHVRVGRFLSSSETFIYRRICDPQITHSVVTDSRINVDRFALPASVSVQTFVTAHPLHRWLDGRLINRTGQSSWYTQMILHENADIVFGHFSAGGWMALPACWIGGLPLIVALYGSDLHTTYREDKTWRRRTDLVFRRADAIVVSSDYMANDLSDLGCEKSKIVRIRCGIDTDALPFCSKDLRPDEPLRILCVARLHPVKRISDLLSACRILKDNGIAFELRLIGDGPLREHLQRMVDGLGLAESVQFLLDLSRQETIANFGWCHVLVLASQIESQGIVLQEAQAVGAPVIATRTGALPEGLIDGETGLLVPLGDPVAIARALLLFVKQPHILPLMGHRGRRFVEEKFGAADEIRQLRLLYSKILRYQSGKIRQKSL